MGIDARNMSSRFANNKGPDQHAHTRSLISAFVIYLFESIISKLATSEFSIFLLVSVAWETCLNLALSETPKTDFVANNGSNNKPGINKYKL